MSRAYLCAKSAIDWDNATDAQRSAAIDGARQALIGSDLETIHAARRAKDASLPEFASLNTSQLTELEQQADTVVQVAAMDHDIHLVTNPYGAGIALRSSWYERSLLQRLNFFPESNLDDPGARQLHATWLLSRG
jgi:hypothetical protein